MMQNREHLLQFMLTKKINLSHYDRKFLSNLQFIIHKDNRVTSNQATLFDRLITKYSRQLTKAYLVIDDLQKLPWKTNIVESSSLYTGARISLVGDTLRLNVPFNKKFINEFKHIQHNPFEWDSHNKFYTAEFSTHGLKILTTLTKYFSSVDYCDELNTLLQHLKTYEEILIWDPTLTSVNGLLLVAGCNTIIGEMIGDIELKLEPKILYQLSQMGISIDPKLVENDPKLKFAAEFITEVDIDDENVQSWITELGCNSVIKGKGPFREMHKTQHNSNSLPILIQYTSSTSGLRRYYGKSAFGKCVIVKNSRPIDVK